MKKLLLMLFVTAFLTVACDSESSSSSGPARNADGIEKTAPQEKEAAKELQGSRP